MTNSVSKSNVRKPYKVMIIAPTCFYYQTPLFQSLQDNQGIDLIVLYCSDEALRSIDIKKMYKTSDNWGVESDLLKGYDYKFIRNYSPIPSYMKWPIGLLNLGIWNEIKNYKPDAIILQSWTNPTWWMAALAGLVFKIPVFLMTDQNMFPELSKSKWKLILKKFLLGKLLFPRVTGFLCSGTQNKNLYKHYGVPEHKLVDFAFSWGYRPMFDIYDELIAERKEIRKSLGIKQNEFVISYIGRMSYEKGVFTLLKAYELLDLPHKSLVLIGDGQMTKDLKDYVIRHNIESVRFLGFQSRSEIYKSYVIPDVLVLPSLRESWGIVINEALCFGLPVIVSRSVGAAEDLLVEGENGYYFESENVLELVQAINKFVSLPDESKLKMKQKSRDIVKKWIDRDLPGNMIKFMDNVSNKN